MTNNITRATAQVAPYLEAITQAREAGLTWGDIAARIGIESPDRVRWAAGHCRYKASQIPLPEPETKNAKEAQQVSTRSTPNQSSSGTSPATAGKRLFDSIPKIGGNTP